MEREPGFSTCFFAQDSTQLPISAIHAPGTEIMADRFPGRHAPGFSAFTIEALAGPQLRQNCSSGLGKVAEPAWVELRNFTRIQPAVPGAF